MIHYSEYVSQGIKEAKKKKKKTVLRFALNCLMNIEFYQPDLPRKYKLINTRVL